MLLNEIESLLTRLNEYFEVQRRPVFTNDLDGLEEALEFLLSQFARLDSAIQNQTIEINSSREALISLNQDLLTFLKTAQDSIEKIKSEQSMQLKKSLKGIKAYLER